uniref:SH3 domain-containing protein n=2 Tax=Lutzomyia longipalpis TaxID=7200 RepID=A0A1B0CPU7_LUTLO
QKIARFVPDLVTSCPEVTLSACSDVYEEIEDVRERMSQLSCFTADAAKPTRDPIAKVMGQNVSLRRPRISLTWVLRDNNDSPATTSGEHRSNKQPQYRKKSRGERLFSERYANGQESDRKVCPESDRNSLSGNSKSSLIAHERLLEGTLKNTRSEPALFASSQTTRRHRHRKRRDRNRCPRFGYEITNVDDFLSKASTLYQTRSGGYQLEIPLPLGMVVNAVFKNQTWLYVQTPHAEEGYVNYTACLPLGILPAVKSSKPPPCWETNGDIFPKPCGGNLTDSEKELQMRGTRSEGARTPRSRRSKSCGEKQVDALFLRATSQPKLYEKPAPVRISPYSCGAPKPNLHDEYVSLLPKPRRGAPLGIKSPLLLRETLLAVRENYMSESVSVRKGDVVTLLACKEYRDKNSCRQWFFVKTRDGGEGYIPAEVAGHGFL